MKAVRDGASALTLLDWHTITSIPPSELRRAGAIAERMRAAGFDGIKTQIIVKALFMSSSMSERERERHMELAFDVWDEHHRGVLQLDEFERENSEAPWARRNFSETDESLPYPATAARTSY